MTKTVGFFTSYTPGDGSFLEELQQKYGPRLEQITKREKLLLIETLAGNLGNLLNESPRDEIYELQVELNTKLKVFDKVGLIEALIYFVRYAHSVKQGELPM